MTNEFSAILTWRIFLRSRRKNFFFRGQIMKTLKFSISILGVALLAACGGSDSPHGALIESPALLATLSKAQFDGGPLVGLSGKAKCDVKVISLHYATPGVTGERSSASGVLLLPSGSDCNAAAPLVAYAKGTDVQKPRTLANPADGETFLLAAMYASQGYAVVATDYLGYAKSSHSYHPYLHADSEATSVIDSIRAARNAVASQGASLNGKVMLTGYSQGGHASMAAHRAIEKSLSSEINVVAGAHLAGPYNLSGSMKLTEAIAGYQFFVPFIVTSWQKIYGNLYSDVKAAFKSPYSDYIESLLPSPTLNYTTLVTSGKLPGINGETPNQARDALFQSAFASDIQTNDKNPTFLAAQKNDLLDWTPKSQVLLCGGSGDPTVPPAIHQDVMKKAFDNKGLKNVTSVDVDKFISATYGPVTAANAATYYGNYHGTYEPPFCHAQAKGLFDLVK
jgi:pimeloyl-ACP methyl ester carboxylesterase